MKLAESFQSILKWLVSRQRQVAWAAFSGVLSIVSWIILKILKYTTAGEAVVVGSLIIISLVTILTANYVYEGFQLASEHEKSRLHWAFVVIVVSLPAMLVFYTSPPLMSSLLAAFPWLRSNPIMEIPIYAWWAVGIFWMANWFSLNLRKRQAATTAQDSCAGQS
jgi:hypothetical protein